MQTTKRERLVSIVQLSVIKQPGIAEDINYREGEKGIKIRQDGEARLKKII